MLNFFPLKINIRQSGINQVLYVKNSDDKIEIYETNSKGYKNTLLETRNGHKSRLFLWFRFNWKSVSLGFTGIAVSILFVTIGYTSKFTPEERMYKRFYSSFDKDGKGFYLSSSMLSEAKSQYEQGDYTAALTIFASVPKQVKQEVEIKFYTGLTFMEIEQHHEAVNYFESVITLNKEAAYYSYWYLALCKLKLNEVKETRKNLNYIIINDLFNHEKAKKLLKCMDRIG